MTKQDDQLHDLLRSVSPFKGMHTGTYVYDMPRPLAEWPALLVAEIEVMMNAELQRRFDEHEPE
jgi:hypothetical protein